MKTSELATKEDLATIVSRLDKLLKESNKRPLGYLSFDELKKLTGFGDATIWRMENEYQAFRSYKFKGSNKKFYKIAELEAALENEL